ncbi:MAG: uroporphyrinogen-III synthase [Chitinophagales bacterium]|nr:uroporphyrinogen-III synthase [Chitinophagales bacterium]
MVKLKAKSPKKTIPVKVVAPAKPAVKIAYRKVKTILISQPKPETEKNPYSELAAKYNVKIEFRQFIQIEPIPAKDFRKFKIVPTEFSSVVFNSKNAIDHFFRICEEMRTRMSQETKYFCVSEAVALYLQKYILYRKRKVFYGNGRETELVDLMMKHKDTERFLLPCSDVHKEGISELMEGKGLNFEKAIIYKTISSDLSDLKKKFNYDVIIFFSPSGVKSLFDNFPKFKQEKTRLGAFGKTTARVVQERKLHLDIEAPLPESPSMASALNQYLMHSNKK